MVSSSPSLTGCAGAGVDVGIGVEVDGGACVGLGESATVAGGKSIDGDIVGSVEFAGVLVSDPRIDCNLGRAHTTAAELSTMIEIRLASSRFVCRIT